MRLLVLPQPNQAYLSLHLHHLLLYGSMFLQIVPFVLLSTPHESLLPPPHPCALVCSAHRFMSDTNQSTSQHHSWHNMLPCCSTQNHCGCIPISCIIMIYNNMMQQHAITGGIASVVFSATKTKIKEPCRKTFFCSGTAKKLGRYIYIALFFQ